MVAGRFCFFEMLANNVTMKIYYQTLLAVGFHFPKTLIILLNLVYRISQEVQKISVELSLF